MGAVGPMRHFVRMMVASVWLLSDRSGMLCTCADVCNTAALFKLACYTPRLLIETQHT